MSETRNTDGAKSHDVAEASRHDIAVDRIHDYILKSALKAGDMLPTEKSLEEYLKLSRTSIREALRSMEARGIVETKHGVGRFLRGFNYDAFVANLSYNLEVNTRAFKDVIDVRIALELQFLESLLPHYTESDLHEIRAALENMRDCVKRGADERELITKHSEFHLTLYARAENELLSHLIEMFAKFQRELKSRNEYPKMYTPDFLQMHEELVVSIERREPALVKSKLLEHFRDVFEWTRSH